MHTSDMSLRFYRIHRILMLQDFVEGEKLKESKCKHKKVLKIHAKYLFLYLNLAHYLKYCFVHVIIDIALQSAIQPSFVISFSYFFLLFISFSCQCAVFGFLWLDHIATKPAGRKHSKQNCLMYRVSFSIYDAIFYYKKSIGFLLV